MQIPVNGYLNCFFLVQLISELANYLSLWVVCFYANENGQTLLVFGVFFMWRVIALAREMGKREWQRCKRKKE